MGAGHDALQPDDRLSTLSGDAEVVSLTFDGQRVPVYNLSIPDSPTYYIGERGVWVHNCRIKVPSFHAGLAETTSWLKHRGHTLSTPTAGKFGPNKGKPAGMMTSDGKAGYRIEYDGRNGAHINIWSGKGPKTHVIIENANQADVSSVLRQLFPSHYP